MNRNRGRDHSGWIAPLRLPLAGNPETGWQPHGLFTTTTPVLGRLSCHASVLEAGTSPHEPHGHIEEEILIMLSGQADLIVVGSGREAPGQRITVTPGSFVYYPACHRHTLENTGREPAVYLMFKWWTARKRSAKRELAASVFHLDEFADDPAGDDQAGLRYRGVFGGSTGYLGRLHAHLTTVAPGEGYPAHRDPHDVALVMLEGQIETLDGKAEPCDVVYCPAGSQHGLQCCGPEPARYLVFEFAGGADRAPLIRMAMNLRHRLRGPVKTLPGRAVRKLLRLAGLRRR